MLPLDLLKDLVSIPSVNPMGRELGAEVNYESRLSDFLVGLFDELGWENERIEVQPRRDNVIARLSGSSSWPMILLDAHQDTVPVDQMTIRPFEPTEQDGRLYGRGACDVKGGMAAMICAMDRLARTPQSSRPTVVLACTCDEELDQLGAADVVRMLGDCDGKSRLLGEPPNMVVVAEPTELNVGTAHRGVVRWAIRTQGRAVHSSAPERGENAIYRMARLVTTIEQYAARLSFGDDSDSSFCGRGSLSVGTVSGGESVNIVPAECLIEIDRRIVPGEDPMEVVSDLEALLRREFDFGFECLKPTTIASPLNNDRNGDLAESLLRVADAVVGTRQLVALPFTTQAPRYAKTGVPTVVFGPGAIDQAHTADEWISIEQLDQATEILYKFLCRPMS